MKVRNSLRSLKKRDKDCKIVRRKGVVMSLDDTVREKALRKIVIVCR